MDICTPIVAFFFVCIVMPQLVKNRQMFTMAFVTLLALLVLDLIAYATISGFAVVGGFSRFLFILRGVLVIVEFVLLVLATGGLSWREQLSSISSAFDGIRPNEKKPSDKTEMPK